MATKKKTEAADSTAPSEATGGQEKTGTKKIAGLTVGRDVHYYDGTKAKDGKALDPRAAKVAEVMDAELGRCNLTLFLATGHTKPLHDVPYSEQPAPNTWSWMARV